MEALWREEEEGALFSARSRENACLWDRLEMLVFDEKARTQGDGVLLPHESIVLLSDEDAELLQLPEHVLLPPLLPPIGRFGH